MNIVKTPRAIIDILDTENKITGHEIEYHITAEGEGANHFTPKVEREEVTVEEVAKLRQHSDDTLTASNNALNAQVQEIREAKDAAEKSCEEQLAAKEAELNKLRDELVALTTKLTTIGQHVLAIGKTLA